MTAVRVLDLEDAHVGMVDGHAVQLVEAQAEQAARRVEGRLDHLVELQIRLDLRLVEGVLALPQLFGVVAPVPRLEREVAAFLADERLQGVGFRFGARPRRLPHLLEELAARHPASSPSCRAA